MGFSTAFLWPLLTKRFFVYFHAVKMLKNDSFDRISHDNLIKWFENTETTIFHLNFHHALLSLMDESFHWPPVIIYCDVKKFHRLPPK